MSAEIIQIRDFQRKEEREAALARIAREALDLINDTAPSEMHYHGAYIAPDKDPA